MVISFKKKAETETCVVEMDIQDFINLTNLISESTNEVVVAEKPNDPPCFTALSAKAAPTVAAPFPRSFSSSFWNIIALADESSEGTTPASTVGEGSRSDADGLDATSLAVSAAAAAALPHAFGVFRLVCQRSFYAHSIHFLVHNRSGFWTPNAWNPNTFFTQQSETESWILRRMVPSICLLSVGSWIVLVSSSSSSSRAPFNFALGIYASFVATHWADCCTIDLGWSALWRGMASLELFFVTFSFNSWNFVAGCSVVPAFSLYSYLFFITYKTRQRWKRHQQAIHGFDDEVNDNLFNANNSSSRGLEAKPSLQQRGRGLNNSKYDNDDDGGSRGERDVESADAQERRGKSAMKAWWSGGWWLGYRKAPSWNKRKISDETEDRWRRRSLRDECDEFD